MAPNAGAARRSVRPNSKIKKILLESARRENENKDVTYLMRAFIDAGLYIPTTKRMLAYERNRLNYFLVKIGRWEKEGRLVCRRDNGGNRYFKPGEIEQIVKAFNLGGEYYWDYRGDEAKEANDKTQKGKWANKQKELNKKIMQEEDSEDGIINLNVEEE